MGGVGGGGGGGVGGGVFFFLFVLGIGGFGGVGGSGGLVGNVWTGFWLTVWCVLGTFLKLLEAREMMFVDEMRIKGLGGGDI